MPTEIYKTLDFQTVNTVSGLRSPRDPLDAVRLSDLNEAVGDLQEQIASGAGLSKLKVDLVDGFVDGDDTIFEVQHNLNSMDVMEKVFDKTTGESVNTEFVRIISDLNLCRVVFRGNPFVESSQYRLLIIRL